MKNILLIMVMAIFAISCDKGIAGNESVTPENYIGSYVDGDLVLRCIPDAGQTQFLQIDLDNIVSYAAFDTRPERVQKFRQIAERNGDTDFNRTIALAQYYSNNAFADNYRSIHAVSNAAWDDKHPAGESLDDILILGAGTFSDYIRSGYQTMFHVYNGGYTERRSVRTQLDQLSIGDMEMLARASYTCSPGLYFASTPTIDKEHTITLTMTTTDGKVQIASVKCKPVKNIDY